MSTDQEWILQLEIKQKCNQCNVSKGQLFVKYANHGKKPYNMKSNFLLGDSQKIIDEMSIRSSCAGIVKQIILTQLGSDW